MPRPRVGVVVTTYNYGRFLGECLRSLEAQTLPPDTVVVVDDASDDDTAEVLSRELSSLSIGSRLTVVRHATRQGLATSLNDGFARCDAEFIAHVDADDRCLPRYLEALSGTLASTPSAGYAYPRLRLTGSERGVYETYPFDGARLYWTGNYIPNVALLRRECFLRTSGYRPLPTHLDWDFWLQLLELGVEGVFHDEVLYEWRRHAGAMTYRPRGERLRARLSVQARHRSLARRYAASAVPATWQAVARRLPRTTGVSTLTASGWVTPDPIPTRPISHVQPTITALMACHNRRELTERSVSSFVESARRAGCRPSVVLADDGSTDGTADAVRGRHGDLVQVVHGPGTWYWARSMSEAESRAWATPPDYFLWLNDDVTLDQDAVSRLLAAAPDASSIVTGPVRDLEGAVTYAGYRAARGFGRLRLDPVRQTSQVPRPLDAANGNCLLVPQEVAARVGAIDGCFAHAYADLDYTLRAREAGFPCVQAPGTFGVCAANPVAGGHLDPARSLVDRLRFSQQPKGIPFRSQVRFLRRHGGRGWLLVLLKSYLHVIWPQLVSDAVAERVPRDSSV